MRTDEASHVQTLCEMARDVCADDGPSRVVGFRPLLV
jgi:hypothetical protein